MALTLAFLMSALGKRKKTDNNCADCHARVATEINIPCNHTWLCEDCTHSFRNLNGLICPLPGCNKESSIFSLPPSTLINCDLCYEQVGSSQVVTMGCLHYICVNCALQNVRYSLNNKQESFDSSTLRGIRCPIYARGCTQRIDISRINILQRVSITEITAEPPLSDKEIVRYDRFATEGIIPPQRRLFCVNKDCPGKDEYGSCYMLDSQLIQEKHTENHQLRFECHYCLTPMCRQCRNFRTGGSILWHEGISCDQAQKEAAIVRIGDHDLTASLVEITTKPCPNCGFRVTRWQGHACHHISPATNGCPQCHVHWCYACGTAGKEAPFWCGSTPTCDQRLGRGYCSNEDVTQHVDNSSGWPVDDRCQCPFCPDCRQGEPCVLCGGDCAVCKGLVSPGKMSLQTLSVSPGKNSIKFALMKAKRSVVKTTIHLEEGLHQVMGSYVVIDFPITIIGTGKNTIVDGGFELRAKGTVIKNMVLRETKGHGVIGKENFVCDTVWFDKCGSFGVIADRTKGTLINCKISNCRWSGVFAVNRGSIQIEGENTMVHDNCTDGNSDDYGLNACSTSKINISSSLTKDKFQQLENMKSGWYSK